MSANEKNKYKITAFLAYALYFLTGVSGIVVGSSLSHLVKMYGIALNKVVLLGSFYAMGRVLTVYLTGKMVEKFGPLKVLTIGTILIGIFLIGIPTVPIYYAGLVFAFLGGIGMGTQDTVCPVLLSIAFHDNYAGAMSAGQAFYGLGNFTTPFLIGIMLSGRLPFYCSYYVLEIIPVIMVTCIPLARKEIQGMQKKDEEHKQYVKPLYTKKIKVVFSAVIVGDIAYCAVVNGIMTYTSSFAESLGISASISAFMLTAYNVGCFIGSLVFIVILRKVKEQTVLLVNSIGGVTAIIFMLFIDKILVYFICLLVAGFFLGVLFSVYVTIATRTDYRHVSRAASVIGVAGGGSDILTPVITGVMVSLWGVKAAYIYVIIMSIISIISAFILRINISEEVI